MRKITWAVVAAAGLGLLACKNERQKLESERADVAEKRQDVNKEIAEIRQETAKDKIEADQKANREIQEQREELAEEKKDVVEAQKDVAQANIDESKTGGSVTGMLKSTMGNNLTIQDRNGVDYKLETNDTTKVQHNGMAVKLDDFREGSEVRASFTVQGDEKVAQDVEILSTPFETKQE